MNRLLTCWLLLLTSLAACAPTETGNPDAAVTLVGETSDSAYVLSTSPVEGMLTLSNAWFAFSHLRFVPGSDCTEAAANELSGPLLIDLARERRVFPNTLDAESYCEFRVGRTTGPADSDPAEFEGAHFLLQGWRHDGAALTVRSTATPELISRGFMGAEFDLDVTRSYVLAYNLSSLFDNVDVFLSIENGDGSITISDDSNADQLTAIETNQESALALFEDVNGNRARDADETAIIAKQGI